MTEKHTLFDPFFGSTKDVRWKRTQSGESSTFRIVYNNVADEVETLGRQFADGVPGWQAVLMGVEGFDSHAWGVPSKREIMHQLVMNVLPNQHQSLLLFLPENLLLLVTREDSQDKLRDACVGLAHLIVDGETKVPSLRFFDLMVQGREFAAYCDSVVGGLRPPVSVEDAKREESADIEAQLTFHLTPLQMDIRRSRTIMHALVVEDDPATAALLVQLVNQKFDVVTAHDAVQAVREYRHFLPDMVLLDIGLPDVNGLHLLEKMVAGDPQSYVVMLTANAFKSNLDAALAAGAKGFMAKPFKRDRLNYYLSMAEKFKAEKV